MLLLVCSVIVHVGMLEKHQCLTPNGLCPPLWFLPHFYNCDLLNNYHRLLELKGTA